MTEQEPLNPLFKKEQVERSETLKEIDNVKFTVNEDKRKNKYYVSSSIERKMIELDSSSDIPLPEKEYRVEILQDTRPDDPQKGKYIARIVAVSEREISPVEWQTADEVINEIEFAVQKDRLLDRELYQETGITKKERGEGVEETLRQYKKEEEQLVERELRLLREKEEARQGDGKETARIEAELARIAAAKNTLVNQALIIGELEEINRDIKSILGGHVMNADGSPEQQLVGFRKAEVIRVVRMYRELEKFEERLRIREGQLLQNIEQARKSGEPARGKERALEKIRGEIEEAEIAKRRVMNESPEAFYGIHLLELKHEKETYQRGEIVELPSVKENIDDIVLHLRGGEPVLLYGHYGTGKTELAMHIARKYLKKDALIISGSKDTSLADLYGHHVLKVDKPEQEELKLFIEKIEKEYLGWLEKNAEATKDEKDHAHERILQTYLTTLGSGTVTEFVLGKINQALVEDRPIIIDEVNAIPHETLISLNHLLTRRAGTKMQLQRDSNREVEVGIGYNVMMTGNLGRGEDKYTDRQEMDPAFLSRLYKKEIDYLPQDTVGTLGELGGQKELFRLMIGRLMDRHGNLELPRESIEKVWDFAKVCRIFQDVFSGKNMGSTYYKNVPGGPAKPYFLQESVPSHREISRVLDQWQREDFKYELDYYIWREFFSQSMNQADREYMFQIMKNIYGFFDSISYANIVHENKVKNAPLSLSKEMYAPRQTVEFVFGKGPQRKKWPRGKNRKKKQN